MSAGRLERGDESWALRVVNQFASLDEIRALPVNDQGVRLGDVATIALAEPDLDYARHLDLSRAEVDAFKALPADELVDCPLVCRCSKDSAIQESCCDVVSRLCLFGEVQRPMPRGDRCYLGFADTGGSSNGRMCINFVSRSKVSTNDQDHDLP
jgi:hypothetical protein